MFKFKNYTSNILVKSKDQLKSTFKYWFIDLILGGWRFKNSITLYYWQVNPQIQPGGISKCKTKDW